MSKVLMLIAIAANALGFGGISKEIDRSNVDNSNLISINQIMDLPQIKIQPSLRDDHTDVTVAAQSYLLIDEESGKVFAEKNANEKYSIASTTKIMTAVIALENYKLDDVVTVGTAPTLLPEVKTGLLKGEKISVLNLLKSMLIKSGNDSANALAEYMNDKDEVGTKKFVDKMNAKARELNMVNTVYLDPVGLNDGGKSSSADLVTIVKYALKNETFANIVSTNKETVSDTSGATKHDLQNTNLLLSQKYAGVIGVKTGFTGEAGHCLVSAVNRDGHTLIAVVLNTKTSTDQAPADESKKLYDWGFANIIWPN
ncbi:MAG: D-alanyl-D-alanine carboxypeptidase family protein [Candidatus Berkelbacteria bacterium]